MKKRGVGTLAWLAALALVGCQQADNAADGTATAPMGTAPAASRAVAAPDLVNPATSTGALAAVEGTLEKVYEDLNPSVVNISMSKTLSMRDEVSGPYGFPFPFPGMPGGNGGERGGPRQAPRVSGAGSGFVYDTKGHIVTNNHVVADADRIRVTFADGTSANAKVVGTDPASDLAVIKVELPANRLKPVTLADSAKLKVGQLAVAIGNPFGLDGTMTVGYVSALGRVIPAGDGPGDGPSYTIPDMIQTDAPINPGNSGGVLADSAGNIIGVTTAIKSPSGTNAGIGFAVPSAIVAKVAPKLISEGKYAHPYLGIQGMTMLPEIAKAMNLPEDTSGALVGGVTEGSPADKAGVRGSDRRAEIDGEPAEVGGDIITAFDGQPVKKFDDLVTELARRGEVGKSYKLTVLRDGKSQDLDITLAARPAEGGTELAARPSNPDQGPAGGVSLGVQGVDVPASYASSSGLPADRKGVMVVSIVAGSPADKAGLRGGYKPSEDDPELRFGGDIITGLNGKPIAGIAALQEQLRQLKPGASATATVWRDGRSVEVKLQF